MSDSAKTGHEGDLLARLEASDFASVEAAFNEVLGKLVGDKSLDKFREEYEKLFSILKKKHEDEAKLIQSCRTLNSEIVNNAAKVQTALKLNQEDQTTISQLKSELEKAWKLIDTSHDKEITSRETIEDLREEIVTLNNRLQQNLGLSPEQQEEMDALVATKEDLERKYQSMEEKNKELQYQLEEAQQELEAQDAEKADFLEEIAQIKDSLKDATGEIDRADRRKQNMDRAIEDMRTKLLSKESAVAEYTHEIEVISEAKKKITSEYSDIRTAHDKLLRENDAMVQRIARLVEDSEKQALELQQQLVERNSLQDELKRNRVEITKLSNDCELLQRKLDKEKKSVLQLKQNVQTEKGVQLGLEGQISQLNKDLQDALNQGNQKERDVEGLKRAAEINQKMLMRETQQVKNAQDQFKVSELGNKNLETEIISYRNAIVKMEKTISQLEKERDKYGADANEANMKLSKIVDQLKLKDIQLSESHKKVAEGENRLKQQQSLYDSLRSDRNQYSKSLSERQDEVAELKRKFKIMNHQVEQLKDEVNEKDQSLVKQSFELQKVSKQKDQLKNELFKLKSLVDTNETTISSQNGEVVKLAQVIKKLEEDMKGVQNDYHQAISERDILGTQLIRRNDELALLYEKLKLQHTALKNGETQYNQRLDDIRVLRLKIDDMKRDAELHRRTGSNADDLKREFLRIQKELQHEQAKVKALSEELETPMNVHRWRKLEGSDPTTYEMIQKIQTLQKRLILKAEQVAEKDLVIQEKDKAYNDLKTVLARQPGPEVAEQLTVYQQSLKEKTRQMKAMASELNMQQALVNEYKFEMERISKELQETKKKYYVYKKQHGSKADDASKNADVDPHVADKVIAGGGYLIRNS